MAESKPNKPDDKTILIMANQFLSVLPHCQALGMSIVSADQSGVTVELPWSEEIVGNMETGVIHSGVVTTLMDTTCGISTVAALPAPEACPTLDLRIDHMTTPEPHKSLFATVEAYRVTRNIVFTRCTAWQESPDHPIAHAVGTFMRLGKLLPGKMGGRKKQGEEKESSSES